MVWRWQRRFAEEGQDNGNLCGASGRRTSSTAQGAQLQAFARSTVRRETDRYRRPLSRPPAHAVVLSIDEKSQIQAIDRT
jgi:hypothetical protein